MNGKSIKITDTTLRDAQQSMWAPYISEDDLKLLIKDLDQVGFHSLEVWGGGTFEACLRYWNENPWKRLETIKKFAKNTPLQMVIRAKSIVGYHHYSNDVLESFIKESVNKGISIVRVFDPLNDINNIKEVVSCIKNNGAHAQGTICYTISKQATIQYFVNFAKKLKEIGADSIVLKDSAGILTPDIAVDLIQKIKKEVNLPLQLHSHLTNGIVNITYYEAIKNGIDIIDCCLAAFSLPASQPAVENLSILFSNTEYEPKLNKVKLFSVSGKLAKICREKEIEKPILPLNDYSMFEHQLPRAAYIFLFEQLKKRNSVNKLEEVLKEIPRVRKDLGDPPLFAPLNIFIVAQSVYNVLMEKRYQLIPREIKEYINGAYGKVPGKINQKILEKIKGSTANTKISQIEPLSLKNAYKNLNKRFVKDQTDYITYALFPELATEFFIARENPDKTKKANLPELKDITPEEELLMLNKLLDEKNINEFEFNEDEQYIFIQKSSAQDNKQVPPVYNASHIIHPPVQPYAQAPLPEASKKEATKAAEQNDSGDNISSPIVGIFYMQPGPSAPPYVKIGDKVNKGQTVCIIEAMKVMNEIKAPYNCEITKVLVKDKDAIQPKQALFSIKKI